MKEHKIFRGVFVISAIIVLRSLPVFAIEKKLPVAANPGFELKLPKEAAKGWVLLKDSRLAISKKFAKSGRKSLLIKSGGDSANYVRQEFECHYTKPLRITPFFTIATPPRQTTTTIELMFGTIVLAAGMNA